MWFPAVMVVADAAVGWFDGKACGVDFRADENGRSLREREAGSSLRSE